MSEMTVFSSFLVFFVKAWTPEGPKFAEMVTYRHFMLHQSIILSKMRKLGLIIHPAGFFRLYFMTNMVVLRLFLAYLAKVGTSYGPKWIEMSVYRHFTLHQTFILQKSWKFGLRDPQTGFLDCIP